VIVGAEMSRLVHHRLEGTLMPYLILGFAVVSGHRRHRPSAVTTRTLTFAAALMRGHGVSGETAAGSQDVPGAQGINAL
jgi:hypothetical protein